MANIGTNITDRLTSLGKAIVGICPIVGPLAAEAIGSFIPNQRLDRVVQFLRELEQDVHKKESRIKKLETNLQSPEGLDLFEEGLIQASRATSEERKQRLARIISRSLTSEKIQFEESKKILNLFRELTDPEIVWLLYYSMNPTLGTESYRQIIEENPDVLKPIPKEMGAPQDQLDRRALQDSYKNTLLRFGLTQEVGQTTRITTLGELLVRYIDKLKSSEG